MYLPNMSTAGNKLPNRVPNSEAYLITQIDIFTPLFIRSPIIEIILYATDSHNRYVFYFTFLF